MKPHDLKGLFVPLLTPLQNQEVDQESLIKFVHNLDDHIDGYVVCGSTGEGGQLPDQQWEKVVRVVTNNTSKPVIAAILRQKTEDIITLGRLAQKIGAAAVMVAPPLSQKQQVDSFFKEISRAVALPIVAYNTEASSITNVADMLDLDTTIIGLKDSSGNIELFKKMIELHKSGQIHFSLFQGMENRLLDSVGCDGYILSLANIEPKLCREMFQHPSEELNDKILKLYEQYELGGDEWYRILKKILAERAIFSSAEVVRKES